ncbi:AraC family ligand binding domain-containing protein [Paenibacillus sp. GCM10012303]|uniref:AraC family ligand binding domain-containing protein n=1 Tax=Paenibacillus sp. GCM10012303 TaxID=3317340 RepID=UPI00360904BC
MTEGTGTNVLNGVSHPLERGSLFLLTPADFHEVYPDPDSVLHIYNVIFSEDIWSASCANCCFTPIPVARALGCEEAWPAPSLTADT